MRIETVTQPIVKMVKGGKDNGMLVKGGLLCCHGCHRPFGKKRELIKDEKGRIRRVDGTGLVARKIKISYKGSWGTAYLCQYCIKQGMKEGRIKVGDE